jgi:hypothetical protein
MTTAARRTRLCSINGLVQETSPILSTELREPKGFWVGEERQIDGMTVRLAANADSASALAGTGAPAAPPDLFDAPPSSSTVPEDGDGGTPTAPLPFGRLIGYAGVVTALGFLFRFPTTLLFLLPFVGVGLSLAMRSPHARPFAYVVFASGFAAQVTSIFITPFTWMMRFGFFFALLGALGAIIRSQLKQL